MAKLCMPGGQFILNVEGALWKILRKDLTTIAQTWSMISYFNIPPKPHLPEIETQNHHLEAANQNGQFDFIYFLISFGLVFDFELD